MLNDADPAGGRPESRAAAYTTLPVGPGFRSELEIRRSRFITVLRRTEDEHAARALVNDLRKEFHDARHHCSAFILGADRGVQRSSDDGEPAGTAGSPMLEALLKRETVPGESDLSDITAVVVRYFGGVLLGAGGLVRAYSESVSAALDRAPLAQRRRLRLCSVRVGYTGAGRLENDLRNAGYLLSGTRYEDSSALLTVALQDQPDEISAAADRIAALTGGSTVLERGETEWVDVPPHPE